jgi:hypothetical protein
MKMKTNTTNVFFRLLLLFIGMPCVVACNGVQEEHVMHPKKAKEDAIENDIQTQQTEQVQQQGVLRRTRYGCWQYDASGGKPSGKLVIDHRTYTVEEVPKLPVTILLNGNEVLKDNIPPSTFNFAGALHVFVELICSEGIHVLEIRYGSESWKQEVEVKAGGNRHFGIYAGKKAGEDYLNVKDFGEDPIFR